MEQYIKKHTIIFCLMFIFIIVILLFSYLLIDSNDILKNRLIVQYKNDYLMFSITDDFEDLTPNELTIYNPTNQVINYDLYLKEKNANLNKIYYKVNEEGLKKLSKDNLIYHGKLDKNEKEILNISIASNDTNLKNADFKIEIKEKN